MQQKRFANLDELRGHLLKKIPTLYVGSRTSTVLPFEKMEVATILSEFGLRDDLVLGDLSSLPKKMTFNDSHELFIEGPVPWQEAKEFCERHGRRVMTSPTEEWALCLSGVATSATGEKSFAYGALKDQLISVDFLNQDAEPRTLRACDLFEVLLRGEKNELADEVILRDYQKSYEPFRKFKNAPFPRFEKATDLMAGTEGQLGVITAAVFKTVPLEREMYLLMKLPKWDENFEAHQEIFQAVQGFRGPLEACEFMDHHSLSHLPQERSPVESGVDLLFLQMGESQFERIYEELIQKLHLIRSEDVFEMSAKKCRELRMDVPRYVFEHNARNGVTKVGTDVQVTAEKFPELVRIYRNLRRPGLPFNLFGHFGDAHLHYNLMPKPEQMPLCKEMMEEFYSEVKELGASPFAEHGIGILKKHYIQNYYTETHRKLFAILKEKFDANNIFFPGAFMSPLQKFAQLGKGEKR